MSVKYIFFIELSEAHREVLYSGGRFHATNAMKYIPYCVYTALKDMYQTFELEAADSAAKGTAE